MTEFAPVVIIPAYNAEETIGKVVSEVRRYIANVLVVDDGSVDDSSARAIAAGATVISLEKNAGKGAALAAGFEGVVKSSYNPVITIDADGQHQPRFIPDYIKSFAQNDADLIIGSRNRSKLNMPLDRRISNWTTSHILSILLGRRIEDSQCGFRLYSKRLLEGVRFESRRFEIETEAIIKAVQGGYNVQFIPIEVDYIAGFPTHINRLVDTMRWCRRVLELI